MTYTCCCGFKDLDRWVVNTHKRYSCNEWNKMTIPQRRIWQAKNAPLWRKTILVSRKPKVIISPKGNGIHVQAEVQPEAQTGEGSE